MQEIVMYVKHNQGDSFILPLSMWSSLVKSILVEVFIMGVNAAPSLNCMKFRSAASAACMRAIFLLLPCPRYFWPSTYIERITSMLQNVRSNKKMWKLGIVNKPQRTSWRPARALVRIGFPDCRRGLGVIHSALRQYFWAVVPMQPH